MAKKTKVKIFQKFCVDNNMSYDIWFHEKDDHNRTIELNADVTKNGYKSVFFMAYDNDTRVSRFELKFEGEWFCFNDLQKCLDAMWLKTVKED